MPTEMRYEFTLGGRIPISNNVPPSSEGKPREHNQNEQLLDMEHSGATYKTQIPEALWKVMKYRGGHTPVWSKDVLNTLVGEVKKL